MVVLEIADVKDFMGKLLLQEVFDNFLVEEAEIKKYATFRVDGFRNRSWDAEEQSQTSGQEEGREDEDPLADRYVTWKELRPTIKTLIQDKKAPSSFHMTMMLNRENRKKILSSAGNPVPEEQLGGLLVNLRYEGGTALLITGTAMKGFSLDRTLEQTWDRDLQVFLKHYGIACEVKS